MNGNISSVHGGGIVHTFRIEGRPIQTWVMNEYGIEHTFNGSFIENLP